MYSGEEGIAPAQPGQWDAALRETGSVEWKPALRAAMLLAIPAGLVFGGTLFMGLLGVVWMVAAAAWAVTLYARGQRAAQRPVWLTTGAGARIGLVTGLITGWIAFASNGAMYYARRFVFHQGREIDDAWQAAVLQMQQMNAANQDQQASEMSKALSAWMLSTEGRTSSMLAALVVAELMMVVFAMAGGALGAKLIKAGSRE